MNVDCTTRRLSLQIILLLYVEIKSSRVTLFVPKRISAGALPLRGKSLWMPRNHNFNVQDARNRHAKILNTPRAKRRDRQSMQCHMELSEQDKRTTNGRTRSRQFHFQNFTYKYRYAMIRYSFLRFEELL